MRGERPRRIVGSTPSIDMWHETSRSDLPTELLEAFDSGRWSDVRDALTSGVAPRGVYGREALHLRRALPLGVDPVLTQHRGLAALAFGDWDDVDRAIRAGPTDATELLETREAVLAPLATRAITSRGSRSPLTRSWDFSCGYEVGLYRRLLREYIGWRAPLDERPDVSRGRFARFRRLQEVALAAHIEAVAGDLDAAIALASEGRDLGDEGDSLRVLAADVEVLARHARGHDVVLDLGYLDRVATPRGASPLDAATLLLRVLPLYAAARQADLVRVARLVEEISARLGSSRLQFAAHCWIALASFLSGDRPAAAAATPGLLTEARRARHALRVVPELLSGMAHADATTLLAAESAARRSGHVWAQAAALVWLAALRPSIAVATRARRVLALTGWRRPVGVPPDVGARAVDSLARLGLRGGWLLELSSALVSLSATVPLAMLHIRDHSLPDDVRLQAVAIVQRAGATSVRDELRAIAREPGAVGRAAADWLAGPSRPLGLSERELEVLELAGQGLTDKAIADRLGLSWHTIARHLSNARSKLGATNRSAAAVALEQLRRGSDPTS